MRHLVIRADATARAGTSHLMRCLALAQGWQATGGRVLLVGECSSDALRERACLAGVQMLRLPAVHPHAGDLQATLEALRRAAEAEDLPGGRLVVDAPHLPPAYLDAVRREGHGLLAIDDHAAHPSYPADVVVNPNAHAAHLRYRVSPGATLLLGPRYALLRPEFHAWREPRRRYPDAARRILVAMGGVDAGNSALQVVRALDRVRPDGMEAIVLLGAHNPHEETLRIEVERRGLAGQVKLRRSPEDLPRWMAWADLAVCSPGTASLELAFLGVPMAIAVNGPGQESIAGGLQEAGAAVYLGMPARTGHEALAARLGRLIHDTEARARMSRRGRRLVDGGGCARVVAMLDARLAPDPLRN